MPSRKEDIQKTRQTRLNWLIVGLMLAAITALSFPSYEHYDLSRLTPGEQSPETFTAFKTMRLHDEYATREKVNRELSEIKPTFVQDPSVYDEIRSSVRSDITRLRNGELSLKEVTLPTDEEQWMNVKNKANEVLKYLFDQGIISSKDVFDRFDQQSELVIKRRLDSGKIEAETKRIEDFKEQVVVADQLDQRLKTLINRFYRALDYPKLVRVLIVRNVKPTVRFLKDEFQSKVNEIKSSENWVYRNVSKGDVILQSGELVTKRHLSLLKKMNQKEIRFQLIKGLASLGISILGLVFVYLYLNQFDPEILESSNKLGLICLLVVVTTAITKLVEILSVELPENVEYIIPFAAPVMIASIMIGPELAFILSIFLGLLIVSFFHFTFELFAMFLIGAFVGIFAITRVERRSVLIQSGLVLGAVQMLTVGLFYILRTGEIFTTDLGTKIMWAGVNGVVFVPPLVIGLLPLLENIFDITTNFELLELADLNHPLLRDMFERAPGSFQHSIMLSNLCERAARNIGANALLVRVGAYYHDLGKAEIPEYFIENQGDEDNPHNELKPTLSASILKSHVKKGAERAREAGLPEEVIDLIEQHHGTTTMQFFYHKALEDGDGSVSEEEFQYPGPRPQTREAGICMLGDAVEATSRTLEDPTPNSIRDMVEEIVYDKFKHGQLNECDLTLKDLDEIVETFTRVITSVHHQRIEYPDEADSEDLEDLRDMDLTEPESLTDEETDDLEE